MNVRLLHVFQRELNTTYTIFYLQT
jgi:hypothetical protein